MTDPDAPLDPPLADAGARAAIADELDRTLFVEAGAGSGKTTSLVQRVVSLVRSGVPITDIAAITFTEAAAAELRTRVREALEDAASATPSDPQPAVALAALDDAAITTLHSFSQRILAQHPVEAGLPPVIDLLDEVGSALAFEERWQVELDHILNDPDLRDLVELGFVLDTDPTSLRGVARTMGENWDLLEGRVHRVGEIPTRLDPAPVLSVLGELDRCRDRCTDRDDTLWRALDEWIEPFRNAFVDAGDDLVEVLAAAQQDVPRLGNKGSSNSWPDDGKKEVLALLDEVRTACADLKQGPVDAMLAAYGAVLADFTVRCADQRRTEGQLEFHDLLVLARRLLRTSPSARERLHRRFRHLLIDEFQDTDPIQVELAVRIAASVDHPADTDWRDIAVDEGRLFFVGDPKQSIYRFRRADIGLFTATGERFVDEPTELVTNFRSVPGIVDTVNAVFADVMEPVAGAQPEYAPLVARRPALDGDPGPPVTTFGGPSNDRVDAIRMAEAADVAALARTAVAEGWLVGDGDTARPARLSDIAILIPARTSLPYLESALSDAGVPYRTETGSLVHATAEVHELMAVLAAIDDPGDRVAVVGALRSSAYGCGDDDLHSWKHSDASWSYLAPPPEGMEEHPVARAFADLRRRHDDATWQSVGEIVDSVVRDRHLMELALLDDRPRDLWRRYRVLVDQARQFADAGAGRLREFIRWSDLLKSDTVRVSEPVLPESDLDAVRIGTVHGSKGLEYPIVIVAGVTVGANSRRSGVALEWGPDGTFALQRGKDVRATDFDALRTVEEVMDDHERIRLLYVALTRARDHLAISCHHKVAKAAAASHGQRLHGCLHGSEDVPHYERPDDLPPLPSTTVAAAPTPTVLPGGRPAVIAAARRAGAIAATGVARIVAERRRADDEDAGAAATEPDPLEVADAAPHRRGRAGTGIGRAVHNTLELVDLAGDHDLHAIATGCAAAEGVADAVDLIEAKVTSALGSEIVRAAVASGRVWKEVPVAVPVDDELVLEGFIDLMYEDDTGGLVIVDYKTDSVRGRSDIDRALDRYRAQGAAYAVAMAEATGKPVHRVVFLFLADAGPIEVDIDDLPAAIAEVRAALATVGEQS